RVVIQIGLKSFELGLMDCEHGLELRRQARNRRRLSRGIEDAVLLLELQQPVPHAVELRTNFLRLRLGEGHLLASESMRALVDERLADLDDLSIDRECAFG